MRQWSVRDGLDFCHVQYAEVGSPLVEPIKRIVIGAEEVRHPGLPSNGVVEHPTKCGTIDRAGMDAEANDPARVLIHDHQGPVGSQHGRFAPEQIHARMVKKLEWIEMAQLAVFSILFEPLSLSLKLP